MKSLRRLQIWGRATLPPDWILGALALLYVFLEVGFANLAMNAGPVIRPGDFLIGVAAVLYGLFRGTAFHPAFRPEYRRWLASTPWTNRLPLPVGPIHLVPQDVFVVGSLCALAWARHPNIPPAYIVITFLFLYEAMLVLSFAALKMVWYAYGLAFGLGLLVLVARSPVIALAVATALYSVTFVGLRRALDNFENWELDSFDEGPVGMRSLDKWAQALRQSTLGFPFDSIRPTDVAASIKYRDGLMLSLLIGWWAFVLIPWNAPREGLLFPIGLTTFGAGFSRLGVYIHGHSSPINFWGRVFTLRWVIPGYDKVFLAPFSIFILAGLGGNLMFLLPGPPVITACATMTLIVAAALNLGPTLIAWRLTGKHRLSARQLMANKRGEVQEI